jgi:hypothetical protein
MSHAGDGFSMRMEDAVLHGCVPVIIQDNVQVRGVHQHQKVLLSAMHAGYARHACPCIIVARVCWLMYAWYVCSSLPS